MQNIIHSHPTDWLKLMSSSINMNKCWYHQLIFMILCIENVLRSCNPEIKTFFSFLSLFWGKSGGGVVELKHFSIFAILFHFVMHCVLLCTSVRCIQCESARIWRGKELKTKYSSHRKALAVSRFLALSL